MRADVSTPQLPAKYHVPSAHIIHRLSLVGDDKLLSVGQADRDYHSSASLELVD
jgi:hypothetical protein